MLAEKIAKNIAIAESGEPKILDIFWNLKNAAPRYSSRRPMSKQNQTFFSDFGPPEKKTLKKLSNYLTLAVDWNAAF